MSQYTLEEAREFAKRGDDFRPGHTRADMAKAYADLLEATLRQAARGPQFASADELAHWLESLHECDSNGSVGSRKWEAAQVAARAVRGMGSQAARVDERAVALAAFHAYFRDRCEMLFAAFGMEAVDLYNQAALSAQPAPEFDGTSDPRKPEHDGTSNPNRPEHVMPGKLAERQGEFRMRFGACEVIGPKADVLHIAKIIGEPDDHPAAPVGVPDGMALDAEDWAVLRRLRRALPDVGLNGWHRGVTVLDKVLAAVPSAPQDFPECSGNPASCPENEGHGCCKPNPSAPQGVE